VSGSRRPHRQTREAAIYHGERFNGISHLAGAVLALGGATVLVVSASMLGDPWKIVSFSIYGATLVLLYVASTLYHCIRGRAKALLRRVDHSAKQWRHAHGVWHLFVLAGSASHYFAIFAFVA
jgi:predicted membrane channel-forming protein YqfA (hemolysin III family)